MSCPSYDRTRRTMLHRCMLFLGCLTFLRPTAAQIMSVDLGHEFFKVALMRQGAPLEIVLNAHSARKTPTATSFMENVRAFGSDALAHTGKAPAKVPMFFHTMLGENFTSADDVKPGGAWWNRFALGTEFYSYDMVYESERGVPAFSLGSNRVFSGEVVLANILFFAQQMAQTSADGAPVKDVVITVPSDANLRQRQAVAAAAEIVGLRLLTLVHETSAFAVQRAVDYMPAGKTKEHHLFFNLGSRKAEVTIAQFGSREAGMVAGRNAPVVKILGSATDYSIGGHFFDLKIASVMLKKFQEKYPKLADGVGKNARALRKLINTAVKTKAVLSANKKSPFTVESLYEDTDFQASITREEFEEMCKDMLDQLTAPVEKALAKANITMSDIGFVEVVGGGWRVPKIQQILSEYFEKGTGKKLPLGQHLNGEEGAAMGSALVGANSSNTFRVKKIYFTDITAHSYSVQVTSLTGSWEKNRTVLYPVGAAFGGKKKLSFAIEEDFAIRLFEDGNLLSVYNVSGLADKIQDKWKDLNATGPKVSVNVNLETSGLIEVKNAVATIEESYFPKPKKNKSTATNSTSNDTTDTAEDPLNAELEGSGNKTADEAEQPAVAMKKRKHEKKLYVKVMVAYPPVPLSADTIGQSQDLFKEMAKQEEEIAAVQAVKNELEAAIYGARDKMEMEEYTKVTSEEQRGDLTKLCTELEEWMYEGATAKADYDDRVAKLQNLLGPIQERVQEADWRPDVISDMKDTLAEYKKKVADVKNEPLANQTFANEAEAEFKEIEAWWQKKLDKQNELTAHEAPAFTKANVLSEISKTKKKIDQKVKAALKDKAKKEEAKKKEKEEKKEAKKEKKAEEKAKKDKAKIDKIPSEMSLKEAEDKLAEVHERKKAAVQADNFDEANALKEQEKKLRARIDEIKWKKDTKSAGAGEEKKAEEKTDL